MSSLDRGQAEVLERIATGDELPAVLRQIAELTVAASGQHAVRITTETLSLTLPAGADVSAAPAWRQTFQASTTDAAGTLEVFGDSTTLDDTACTAFLRCCDLASLALDGVSGDGWLGLRVWVLLTTFAGFGVLEFSRFDKLFRQ